VAVTTCNQVASYQRFEQTYCLRLQGEIVDRNFSILKKTVNSYKIHWYLSDYTWSHPRTQYGNFYEEVFKITSDVITRYNTYIANFWVLVLSRFIYEYQCVKRTCWLHLSQARSTVARNSFTLPAGALEMRKSLVSLSLTKPR
jgi:hypothetical protein